MAKDYNTLAIYDSGLHHLRFGLERGAHSIFIAKLYI